MKHGLTSSRLTTRDFLQVAGNFSRSLPVSQPPSVPSRRRLPYIPTMELVEVDFGLSTAWRCRAAVMRSAAGDGHFAGSAVLQRSNKECCTLVVACGCNESAVYERLKQRAVAFVLEWENRQSFD